MKTKVLICVSFCMLSLNVFCQEKTNSDNASSQSINQHDNNELRINLLMSIIGLPELNYERFFADNMGVGLAVSASIDKVENMSTRSIILPYYRLYFGTKKASGFFIEGNMAVVGQKELYYNLSQSSSIDAYYVSSIGTHSTTNFGFGCAIGIKLLTRSDFTGEAYLGAGRLFGESIDKAYPRVGVCIGKRF